jgi:hypothetical protein
MNKSIITEYMAALGWKIDHPDFWQTSSSATLVWDDCLGRYSGPMRCDVPPPQSSIEPCH